MSIPWSVRNRIVTCVLLYRVMYAGYNANLGGSQGRFEAICLAEGASQCP